MTGTLDAWECPFFIVEVAIVRVTLRANDGYQYRLTKSSSRRTNCLRCWISALRRQFSARRA